MLPWTLFKFLFMSAVICKQKLLCKNEIVEYLWKYKWYCVYQGHFRKHLQRPYKKYYPKKDDTFFMNRWILAIFNVEIIITLALYWQN